jgi:hypothetical protein
VRHERYLSIFPIFLLTFTLVSLRRL